MIDVNAPLTEETTKGLTERQHAELLEGYGHGYNGISPQPGHSTVYTWGWNGGQAVRVRDMASRTRPFPADKVVTITNPAFRPVKPLVFLDDPKPLVDEDPAELLALLRSVGRKR